jgi:hypothetical protein
MAEADWFMNALMWWLYCQWIQGPVNWLGFWMYIFTGENWSTDILLGLEILPPAAKTFGNFN